MDKIHETAIIEGDVQLGDNVEIGAFCYIKGPAHIGDNTRIFPFTSIGCEGEFRDKETLGNIHIGKNCIIREHVTIQRGQSGTGTQIGDNCYIMNKAHIAHDCYVDKDVTISAGAVLAGHVTIMKGANIGINSSIHQFSVIGSYAMIGAGSIVVKDVPPFCLVAGTPAKFLRFNTHNFKKLNIKESDIKLVFDRIESINDMINTELKIFKLNSTRKKVIDIK